MFKPCGARGGRPRLTLGHRPTGLLKAKPRFGSLQVLSVCFKANSSVREQRGKEPLFAAAGCPPERAQVLWAPSQCRARPPAASVPGRRASFLRLTAVLLQRGQHLGSQGRHPWAPRGTLPALHASSALTVHVG